MIDQRQILDNQTCHDLRLVLKNKIPNGDRCFSYDVPIKTTNLGGYFSNMIFLLVHLLASVANFKQFKIHLEHFNISLQEVPQLPKQHTLAQVEEIINTHIDTAKQAMGVCKTACFMFVVDTSYVVVNSIGATTWELILHCPEEKLEELITTFPQKLREDIIASCLLDGMHDQAESLI